MSEGGIIALDAIKGARTAVTRNRLILRLAPRLAATSAVSSEHAQKKFCDIQRPCLWTTAAVGCFTRAQLLQGALYLYSEQPFTIVIQVAVSRNVSL